LPLLVYFSAKILLQRLVQLRIHTALSHVYDVLLVVSVRSRLLHLWSSEILNAATL
jgi:hypothetical protein